MKIRKTLPLVLLAVATLFLLTSCDALLDAIYPAPSNTLNVYAEVWKTGGGVHPDWTVSSTTIYLYNGGGTLVSQQTVTVNWYDSNYAYFYASFPKLANGTYTLTASYAGGIGDYSNYTNSFYDPNTAAVISAIVLPDANPSDSSGKTVTVYTYPF
jgi:hypothetical protein